MDAEVVGRAFQNQAIELISICRIFSRVSNQGFEEDTELRRVLGICDDALLAAADVGRDMTNEADNPFKSAIQALDRYQERFFISLCIDISERMEASKWFDTLPTWMGSEDERAELRILVTFVIFKTLPDYDPIIVHQTLPPSWRVSEALWNFSCFKGDKRITLQQNPHFYSGLSFLPNAYGGKFEVFPREDFHVGPNEVIYILPDRHGRVFLETERGTRVFGNVFKPSRFMIFKDVHGVLQGERIVARSIRGTHNVRHYEQPVAFPARRAVRHYSGLQPIITASWADRTVTSENWKDPIYRMLASYNINVHIRAVQPPPEYTQEEVPEVLSPSTPTSEQPGYSVLYTNIDMLNGDILLEIFNHYRLGDEENWNLQLKWCTLSHVCRRWRHSIYSSASFLNIHIFLTNGSPTIDLLAHLPPLPLVIGYRNSIAAEDEESIILALQQHGRIHHIVLQAPSQSLHKLLVPMDGLFPRLEHLSVLSTSGQDTNLILPKTLRAPNLQHLSLLGVGLPTGLSLLTSTISLVVLSLTHTQASGYFFPEHLATHLQHLPQLEELSIGFSIPIPRPNVEGELLRGPITRVMAPSLRRLIFQGVGAYLDSLIARISAPHLERLSITLFNQIVFTLPHLSHFTNTTEGLRHPVAGVSFSQEAVSISIGHREQVVDRAFSLTVNCREFDWQIDSATQICGALMPALSVIEDLTLDLDQHMIPSEWQNALDSAVWHGLLLPFRGVKKLRIGHALGFELSCALDPDDAGLNPELLPDLREVEVQLEDEHANNTFSAFIDARQLADRPVHLSVSSVRHPSLTESSQSIPTKSPPKPPPALVPRIWFQTIRDRLGF